MHQTLSIFHTPILDTSNDDGENSKRDENRYGGSISSSNDENDDEENVSEDNCEDEKNSTYHF